MQLGKILEKVKHKLLTFGRRNYKLLAVGRRECQTTEKKIIQEANI